MYLSTRYIGVIEKLVEFLVRSSLIPNSDTPGVFLLSLKLLQTAVRFFYSGEFVSPRYFRAIDNPHFK